MSISSANTQSTSVIFPAPGWLFFSETLPLDGAPIGTVEDTVLLSLESHAPLPVEQLAYGWQIDSTKRTVIYYAGARDRLRQIAKGIYDEAGHVIPDFMLAPKGKAGEWQWIATPWALTAVRYGDSTNLPLEVRSWNLAQEGEVTNWADLAEKERAVRNQSITGNHSPTTLYWEGAEYARGKKITVTWRPKGGAKQTVTLAGDAAWTADVRERHWLASTKKTRAQTRLFNYLLTSAFFALALVAIASVFLFLKKSELSKEAERLSAREPAVDAINSNLELVTRLDQLEAGQVSFFDALATMNHFRASEILFTTATIDGSRQVQVNGTATTITLINNYVDALRKSGFFTKVELPRVNTTSGRTSFEIKATVGTLAVTRGSQLTRETETEETAPSVPPAPSPVTETPPSPAPNAVAQPSPSLPPTP